MAHGKHPVKYLWNEWASEHRMNPLVDAHVGGVVLQLEMAEPQLTTLAH